MFVNLSENNSLVHQFLSEIRDEQRQKDSMRFRRNLERMGEIMAYEISKHLKYKTTTIQTPLSKTTVPVLESQPVLLSIMRAGLPFHMGFLNYFDQASNAFIAAWRKHSSETEFDIALSYISSPKIQGRILILCDPMLATGASLVKALEAMHPYGIPAEIHVAALISAREGIDHINTRIGLENIHFWTAAIDPHLNHKAYIVPGLGDAGDLSFGTKIDLEHEDL
jgi:uracil phosphoribosyltransferase